MEEPILELRVDDAARAIEALRGTTGVVEAAMFGRSLHVTVADAGDARPVIEEALAAAGVELLGIATVPPSLEDVFVARIRAAGGAPAD
jgi:ABC-2 type transport system ATP-binding protein